MRRKLTDRFLESIKPPETGRDTFSDTMRSGLHLRVGQRKASWLFEKRVKGGPKRKHTLGTYCSWDADGKRTGKGMPLALARETALEIENEAARGVDRIALAETKRLNDEQARAAEKTVAQVIEQYETLKLCNLSTGATVARELGKALADHLETRISALTRPDLQAAIDAHASAGRIVYANRTRAYLRAFTRWAERRGYIANDIGLSLEGAGRELPRDRVLSLPEVRAIYQATFDLGELWGPMFRLLVLTGQRRGEIACLRWTNIDVDGARIELEGRQTKNRKPHIVHLSPPALADLEARREISGEAEYVFTTNGKTPSSGISKAKARLDKLLGDDFQPWRLHDLRRAMASALAASGVPEGVVDRIQNHAATGSAPSAVARVYQQSDLLPQRAAALDRWSEVVTGERATVTTLGTAR